MSRDGSTDGGRRWKRWRGEKPWARLLWLLVLIYAIQSLAWTWRNGQRNYGGEAQAGYQDTRHDIQVDDFGGMWRAALRMSRGETMYYPHTMDRLEMPSKHGPFLETLLLPMVPLGPRLAAWIWHFLSMVLLAGTLWLGQGLARSVLGRDPPDWLPFLGFFLLIPFLHLAARYNQTVFLMVFLTMLALRVIERRPLLAGILLSLPGAIKLLPLVLGPWLLWKRQGRAFAGWVLGLVLSMLPFFVLQGPDLAVHQLDAYVHMIRADSSFASYHERFQGMPSLVHGTVVEDYAPEISSDPHVTRWQDVRNFLGFEPFSSWAQGIVVLLSLLLVSGCATVCRWKRPETLRRWLGEIGLVLLAMLLLSPHTWGHYLWWLYPITLFASIEFFEPEHRRWSKTFLLVLLVMLTLPQRGLLGVAPVLWQAWAACHGFSR